MNEIAKTFVANLKHAYRNRETVTIGGGEFSPAEIKDVLESFGEIVDTKFPNTRAAISKWDEAEQAYHEAMDAVEKNSDIENAEKELSIAKQKLQTAFYKDTKDFNSLESCLLMSSFDIKRIALKN